MHILLVPISTIIGWISDKSAEGVKELAERATTTATCTENLVKIKHSVFEICSRADRHCYRRIGLLHADRKISQGNMSEVKIQQLASS